MHDARRGVCFHLVSSQPSLNAVTHNMLNVHHYARSWVFRPRRLPTAVQGEARRVAYKVNERRTHERTILGQHQRHGLWQSYEWHPKHGLGSHLAINV